jgi:hypothetical protein
MGDILQNWATLSSLAGLNSTKLITFTLCTMILFWKVNKIQFKLHAEVDLSQEICEPKPKLAIFNFKRDIRSSSDMCPVECDREHSEWRTKLE